MLHAQKMKFKLTFIVIPKSKFSEISQTVHIFTELPVGCACCTLSDTLTCEDTSRTSSHNCETPNEVQTKSDFCCECQRDLIYSSVRLKKILWYT